MDEELKPCPFCGREGKLKHNLLFYKVECDFCSCVGPIKYGTEDAIREWNHRYNDK